MFSTTKKALVIESLNTVIKNNPKLDENNTKTFETVMCNIRTERWGIRIKHWQASPDQVDPSSKSGTQQYRPVFYTKQGDRQGFAVFCPRLRDQSEKQGICKNFSAELYPILMFHLSPSVTVSFQGR